MNTQESKNRNKGGRPRKENKKTQVITMKCTGTDQGIIQDKARLSNMSVSEYLVTMGTKGIVEKTERALPKEALTLLGTFHHVAANINQIAKRVNTRQVLLTGEEITALRALPARILEFTAVLKLYFK